MHWQTESQVKTLEGVRREKKHEPPKTIVVP